MKKQDTVVTVIGLGLIGGSLSQALRRQGVTVIGVSSKASLQKAIHLDVIDEGFEYSALAEAVSGSSFVFICTSLLEIEKRIPQVFEHAKKGTVVSDAGSTKALLCGSAQRHLKKGLYFIGGHPMAGSERRGVEHSNPYLFYDAVWVLTPLPGTPKRVTGALSELLSMVGAKVMILVPDLHDRIAACVSHLPQLLAVLLTNQVASEDSDLFRNLAAGGFRDMTRIAASSYTVWRDILRTNAEEIRRAIGSFNDELKRLLEQFEDEPFLEEMFERANRERRRIPKYSKGFLAPLCDLRVSVEDRPGELAKITNLIFYHGINIKDIEIVTVREGEGGILRLGFQAQGEAEAAAAVLSEAGYEVRVT
jgi:prephenate dehydrogenase